MPLYICNAKAGAVPENAKAKIAEDVTRIHCEVTDAPPTFVHVFHFADGPMPPLGDKQVMLYGQIRHGRTDDQKAEIVSQMQASVVEHTGLAPEAVHVFTTDTPASWVMEGGDILPEPGEEDEWLERHNAKNHAKAK
ncbi:tautomerase family protein [Erythrobacter sp. YT30]|uniref:tautomerase family protein n=1 Tax=Erythrobacter sp. YT30 TaxID=1735012 RepID=UPI00076C4334|nr:tautomerase family protein [Erythrobacter sp. YT30]KWV91994.1 hypothetical protein AUC45_12625 [Erythrobacter sp. YT30]